MKLNRIIMDCDTGLDDAVAILMAVDQKNIIVEGLVSVAGNCSLDNSLENNLKLIEDLDYDIPVFKGLSNPLIRKRVDASHIHGDNGLSGPVFNKKRLKKSSGDGIDFIINKVMNNPNEITLVATGPLTDIAFALKKEPRLFDNVKELVLMGGALGEGNVTFSAEFNFFADAEAAAIVFESGMKIIMMGLDVTKQLILDSAVFDLFKADYKKNPNRKKEIFIDCMEFYTKSCWSCLHEYPAMHDPCCIAYLLDPSIFILEKKDIRIETKGEYTYGKSVDARLGGISNTFVGKSVQKDKFWTLLKNSLN